MSEQANTKTISDIYHAFGRGDIGFILAQLADDVRWVSRLDPEVPWAGDFSGKSRVGAFFEAIATHTETEAFEPQQNVAQGDTVVSLGEYACRVKKTGKRTRTRWAFVWKLKDGKVVSYEQFHDPALAEAFR
jgi:ketosteroid isomerase-like protein